MIRGPCRLTEGSAGSRAATDVIIPKLTNLLIPASKMVKPTSQSPCSAFRRNRHYNARRHDPATSLTPNKITEAN